MVKTEKKQETLYTVEQLKNAEEFRTRKDLVATLVKETETISKEQLRKRMKEFSERKVK